MKITKLSLVLINGLLMNTGVSADWSDAGNKSSDAVKEVGHAISDTSSDAWKSTKNVSSDTWDKTKEVSSEAWKGTKGAAHDGAEYVSEKTK